MLDQLNRSTSTVYKLFKFACLSLLSKEHSHFNQLSEQRNNYFHFSFTFLRRSFELVSFFKEHFQYLLSFNFRQEFFSTFFARRLKTGQTKVLDYQLLTDFQKNWGQFTDLYDHGK